MMNHQISRRVAVWVDHQEASLVTFAGDNLKAEEKLFSGVGPHTDGRGWSQHRFEAHRYEMLKYFYEAVIDHLGPADEILILGPGQVKHELHQRIEHYKGLKGKVVALINAPRLTEVELIAQVESFFEANRVD
jgi:hypothetical protein